MKGKPDKTDLKVGTFGQYLPIAISCIIFAFVPMAMQASCLGIYYTAISHDYNVPTAAVTVYLSFGPVLFGLLAPLIGKWYAKYSVRIICTIATLWVAACFFTMSIAPSVTVFVIAGSLLIPGTCTLFNLGAPAIINRWFKDLNGTLIGISAAFTGIGGVVFIPIGNAIMNAMGDYRVSLMVYALIVLVTCLPCSLFAIRSHPEERGLLPYVSKKSVSEEGSATEAVKVKNWTVDPHEVIKTPAFWLFGISGGLCQLVVLFARFFATYVDSLAAAGVAVVVTGAALATIVSAGQAVCKLIVGLGSDINIKRIIILASGTGILALCFIWLCPTNFLMPTGGAIFGFFYATTSVVLPTLAGALFGTGKNYSIVFGRAQIVVMILTIPGGVLWPSIAAATGGYGGAFAVAIACIALYGILSLLAIRLSKRIERIPMTDEEMEKIEENA